MWRKVLKLVIQFLSNHLGILILLALILLIAILYKWARLYEEYDGDFQEYRLDKLELRQERALAKLEGKKPCRLLKMRKKFLEWRSEKLENTLECVNIKLNNTQEILDKYSYE